MNEEQVYQHLRLLAQSANSGDKVPSVRQLMKEFGRSQLVVERALTNLKNDGLIQAEVGRGTFFVGAAVSSTKPLLRKSVLILRRSVSIGQGRVVLELLRERLTAEGHRLLEVSYTDADHARSVLRTIPRFDTCIIQSSFEPVSIETLAAVQQKANHIVFHGVGLTGSEIDCVGHEWGSAVSRALDILNSKGHKRVGFATTTVPNIANAMGSHRFNQHCKDNGLEPADFTIELSQLPHEDYEEKLAIELASRRLGGDFPFSALVAWGVESGSRFRASLAQQRISIPSDLSILLLGRPDMANEHDNFFGVLGASASAQAAGLHDLVNARWNAPKSPAKIVFLETEVAMNELSVQTANR